MMNMSHCASPKKSTNPASSLFFFWGSPHNHLHHPVVLCYKWRVPHHVGPLPRRRGPLHRRDLRKPSRDRDRFFNEKKTSNKHWKHEKKTKITDCKTSNDTVIRHRETGLEPVIEHVFATDDCGLKTSKLKLNPLNQKKNIRENKTSKKIKKIVQRYCSRAPANKDIKWEKETTPGALAEAPQPMTSAIFCQCSTAGLRLKMLRPGSWLSGYDQLPNVTKCAARSLLLTPLWENACRFPKFNHVSHVWDQLSSFVDGFVAV